MIGPLCPWINISCSQKALLNICKTKKFQFIFISGALLNIFQGRLAKEYFIMIKFLLNQMRLRKLNLSWDRHWNFKYTCQLLECLMLKEKKVSKKIIIVQKNLIATRIKRLSAKKEKWNKVSSWCLLIS